MRGFVLKTVNPDTNVVKYFQSFINGEPATTQNPQFAWFTTSETVAQTVLYDLDALWTRHRLEGKWEVEPHDYYPSGAS